MKKTLAIILITIFLPNHLLAKDPKSSYPTFTKWLLDNGYNRYVDIDENGVPRHNLKIKTRKIPIPPFSSKRFVLCFNEIE